MLGLFARHSVLFVLCVYVCVRVCVCVFVRVHEYEPANEVRGQCRRGNPNIAAELAFFILLGKNLGTGTRGAVWLDG